jgi:hypothetical protein
MKLLSPFPRFARAVCTIACLGCVAATAFAQTPVIADDFESGHIDMDKWEIRTLKPDSKIQMTVVEGGAHGRYALQVHYPAGTERSGFAYLIAKNLSPSVRGHLFGRAYVKIPTALPIAHTQLIIAGMSGYPKAKYQEVGLSVSGRRPAAGAPPVDPATIPPRWVFIFQQNLAATPAEGRGEDVRQTAASPYGKWTLLEWEFNDNPTTTRIWIDGKPVAVKEGDKEVETFSYHWPKNSSEGSHLVGGYADVGFGARSFSAGVTRDFDVLYDDIAIGTERLGPVK